MIANRALRHIAPILVLLSASLGPALPALAATSADGSGNLLVNPGFEAPYGKQCCHDEPNFPANLPIDEVQVANGWRAWWRQPSFPDYPPRCDDPQAPKVNCVAFHRPEWRDAATGGMTADLYRNRIHSGGNAQKYFTFYSVHESGMYQQVTNGIQAGQRLRFTIYMEGWSTNTNDIVSNGQSSMNLKVGIDPFGGTNAFSPNVIWSQPNNSYDVYSQFAVEAVAQANAVTVFTYSRPVYALQHNDVYVDDGALTVVGSGSVAPANPPVADVVSQPAPVVVGATSPYPGTYVDANGNIIYIVQPGNTIYSIAIRFGTTIQQLMVWNGLYSATYVQAWAPLIVGKVASPPVVVAPAPTLPVVQPTPVVVAPTAEPFVPAPAAGPVNASGGAVSPYPDTTVDSYGDIIYIVQPGDTVFHIALRFNTTIAQLMIWNGLYSATYIQAGQLLIVGRISP